MKTQEKIGKIRLSSKKAMISVVDGEFEDVKFKLTSGIPGKHGKGGQSDPRFTRNRDERINAFLRKVYNHTKELNVKNWTFKGDKAIVKRFKRINHWSHKDKKTLVDS